jgi:hypothetical protein
VFFALKASISSVAGCLIDAVFSPGGVPQTCMKTISTGFPAALALLDSGKPAMPESAALPAAAVAPRRNVRRLMRCCRRCVLN